MKLLIATQYSWSEDFRIEITPPGLPLVERLARYVFRVCDRMLTQSLPSAEPIQRPGVGSGRIAREPAAGISLAAVDSNALAEAVLRIYKLPVSQRRDMVLRGRSHFEAHFKRDVLPERLDCWLYDLARRPERCAS
jgi:hypothetical protein